MDCSVSRKASVFEPITVSITLKTRAEADAFFHFTNRSATVADAVARLQPHAVVPDIQNLIYEIGVAFREGVGHMPLSPSPFRVLP